MLNPEHTARVGPPKNVELAKAFNSNNVRCQASDPRIVDLAKSGVTVDFVNAACAEALANKPEEKIPIGYVLKIIESWSKRAARPKSGVHIGRSSVYEQTMANAQQAKAMIFGEANAAG